MNVPQSSMGTPYVDQNGKQRMAFGSSAHGNQVPQAAGMVPPPDKKSGGFFDSIFGKKKKKTPAGRNQTSAAHQPLQQQQGIMLQQSAPVPQQMQQQQQQQIPTHMQAPAPVQQQAPPLPVHVTPPAPLFDFEQNCEYYPQKPAPQQPHHIPATQMVSHAHNAVDQQMCTKMELVITEMLDGSVQELPMAVAIQLKELGLCQNWQDKRSVLQPTAMPRPQQQMLGNIMAMAVPARTMMQPMQEDLVELEMPNGSVRMISRSQAVNFGCIPKDDEIDQMQMGFGNLQMDQMNAGDIIEIGPMQVIDGPPIQMGNVMMSGTMQGMNVGGTMQFMDGGMSQIQEEEPLVELILPDGTSQMLPRSQAHAFAQQLMGGGMTNSMADPQYRAMSMQMPVRQQTSVQMPMYQQCMQVPGDMQMQEPMHHHNGMPQQMQYMMQQQSGGYDQYDGQDGLDM